MGKDYATGPFKNALLVRDGRTTQAAQVHNRDMILVEDVAPDSVPLSAEDSVVNGGKRYEQIGVSACERLLEGLLDNMTFQGRGGIFVLDLSLGVASMLEAFVNKRGTYTAPAFYVGLTDCPITKEWAEVSKTEVIAQLFLDGKIAIPGFAKPVSEFPADLLEKEPVAPILKVLTSGAGLHPQIPESVRKTWAGHDQFGEAFEKMLEALTDEFGPAPADEVPSATAPGPSVKNGVPPTVGCGLTGAEPSPIAGSAKRKGGPTRLPVTKKVKIDAEKILDIATVGKAFENLKLLFSCCLRCMNVCLICLLFGVCLSCCLLVCLFVWLVMGMVVGWPVFVVAWCLFACLLACLLACLQALSLKLKP